MLRIFGVLDQRDGGEFAPVPRTRAGTPRAQGAPAERSRTAAGSLLFSREHLRAPRPTPGRGAEPRRAPFAGDVEEGPPGVAAFGGDAAAARADQTPWLTSSKLGLLGLLATFADPDLERDWRASEGDARGRRADDVFRRGDDGQRRRAPPPRAVTCNRRPAVPVLGSGSRSVPSPSTPRPVPPDDLRGRLLRGAVGVLRARDEGGRSSAPDALRAGRRRRRRVAVRRGGGGDVARRRGRISATISEELTADAWSADDRSFFSRGALRDRTGRLCAPPRPSRAASVGSRRAPCAAEVCVRAPVVGRLGAPIRRLRRRGRRARLRHRGRRALTFRRLVRRRRGRVPPRVSPQVQLPREAPRPGEVEQAQKRDEKATGEGRDESVLRRKRHFIRACHQRYQGQKKKRFDESPESF